MNFYKHKSLDEIAKLAEMNKLGAPLKVYRVKTFIIVFLISASIFLFFISTIILLLILSSTNDAQQAGVLPGKVECLGSFLVGCGILLFWLPQERRRQIVICEGGLLSIERNFLKRERIRRIPWSVTRMVDGLLSLNDQITYEDRFGRYSIYVHNFQDSQELWQTVERMRDE